MDLHVHSLTEMDHDHFTSVLKKTNNAPWLMIFCGHKFQNLLKQECWVTMKWRPCMNKRCEGRCFPFFELSKEEEDKGTILA